MSENNDNSVTPTNGSASEDKGVGNKFNIQSIFVKDVSYEAPNVPHIFREQYQPQISMELNTKSEKLADNVFEVVLAITLTAKNKEEKTVFLIEVQQAGVFSIEGLDDKQLHHALGSYCPNLLFPYAREVISSVVARGGFPQVLLAPVNFDNLYVQQLKKQAEAAKGATENNA
ncbi:MAG: protein-export chaperone SecB [Pseudomonadota bacterium]